MDGRELRLLEHVAIRNLTQVDYKVWNELEAAKAVFMDDYPIIDELRVIAKAKMKYMLTDRTMSRLNDAINKSSEVKRAVDEYENIMERNDIRVVCRSDRHYPVSWKELSGMPSVFFARGDLGVLNEVTHKGAAGIVGSRDPGRYSLYATEEFTSKLASKNVVIVSGMALGIDRKAHEACLDAGGKTVAIVPGGADVIYPHQNSDIYKRICENGLVISELPPGQQVIKQYFPSRNRLISALSDVCLIMEAGLFSGTLHTASFAASQGKDVFVLPSSIYDKNSLGGLNLIRDGAEVLIEADTVYERIQGEIYNRKLILNELEDEKRDLKELRMLAKSGPEKLTESEWKKVVCDEISERPRNIDELCISLGIPFTYLSSIVTMLETDGLILNDRGKYVLTIHGR